MGFFNKPEKVKDTLYYSGVVVAAYGKYLVENWPTNAMQDRLGSYFKSIVDFYDKNFNGTYLSNLYTLGCAGKKFHPKWSIEDVKTVLSNNESNLTGVKLAVESFTLRNGPDADIAKALYKCVRGDINAKVDENNEVEGWLVQCVYSTILNRASVKRPRDERNDSYPEAVVSALYGGLMLCCHRELNSSKG